MTVDHHLHTISKISQPAVLRVERDFGDIVPDSTESRYVIDPFSKKWVDTTTKQRGEINTEQIVGYDESIKNALSILQNYEFVFPMYRPTHGYLTYQEEWTEKELEGEMVFQKILSEIESVGLREYAKENDKMTVFDDFVQIDFWNYQSLGLSPEEFVNEHQHYKRDILDIEQDSIRWNILEWWMLNHKNTKIMLYSVLADLEQELGNLLKSLFKDSTDIIQQTGAVSDPAVNRWKSAGKPGTHGIVRFMYFKNILEIFRENPYVHRKIGIEASDIPQELENLKKTRNKVMHPVNSVIKSERDIDKINNHIQAIDGFLDQVS